MDGIGPFALAVDGPWGIDAIEPEGDAYLTRWAVRTDKGAGFTLAEFEFREHAEAFVERCGPAHIGASSDPPISTPHGQL